VRQGNRYPEVRVHTFNQPGTFDAMSYRIIAGKQGFNDVFWKDQSSDTADVRGEEAPNAYDAAIELEQDPLKRRKLEVERDLSQAATKSNVIEKAISNLAKRIKSATKNLDDYTEANRGIDTRTTPKYEDQDAKQRAKSIADFKTRMAELDAHKANIAGMRDKNVVNGVVVVNDLKYSNAEPTISTTGDKPDDFVLINGRKDWGEISSDVAKVIRRQEGKIRLNVGNHDVNTKKGYGLKHIEANHLAHIKNAGFPSVESFIQHVIDNSNELYKAVTGQLLIVARGQNNHVMYIVFRPSKEEGQIYYRINSAFPVRNDNYADKHKFESLIKGRKPFFTGPGDQYGYAALPENKANSGSPNATDENDNRNIPQTNTKSLSSIANIKSWLTTRQQKLMAEGKLKVIQSHSRNRAQGFYKDGVITLVADNLGSKDQVQQVLGHESWHFARDNDARVQTRLKVIDAQFQAVIERVKNGKGTAAEREAWRRVTQANTEKDLQAEEFQSYLLEAYAAKPQTLTEAVQKAVRDLIALIRATLFRYGFNLNSFSVADLAAIARGSLTNSVSTKLVNSGDFVNKSAMPSV
jgi:hypothetical protein